MGGVVFFDRKRGEKSGSQVKVAVGFRDARGRIQVVNAALHPSKPLGKQLEAVARAVLEAAKKGEISLEPAVVSELEALAKGDTRYSMALELLGVRSDSGELEDVASLHSSITLEDVARELEKRGYSGGVVVFRPITAMGEGD